MEGKVAIVTGGTSGSGAGAAKILSDPGASVWITGRDATSVEKAAQNIGVNGIAADATSPADWDMLFESSINLTKIRLASTSSRRNSVICSHILSDSPNIWNCRRLRSYLRCKRSNLCETRRSRDVSSSAEAAFPLYGDHNYGTRVDSLNRDRKVGNEE